MKIFLTFGSHKGTFFHLISCFCDLFMLAELSLVDLYFVNKSDIPEVSQSD